MKGLECDHILINNEIFPAERAEAFGQIRLLELVGCHLL